MASISAVHFQQFILFHPTDCISPLVTIDSSWRSVIPHLCFQMSHNRGCSGNINQGPDLLHGHGQRFCNIVMPNITDVHIFIYMELYCNHICTNKYIRKCVLWCNNLANNEQWVRTTIFRSLAPVNLVSMCLVNYNMLVARHTSSDSTQSYFVDE